MHQATAEKWNTQRRLKRAQEEEKQKATFGECQGLFLGTQARTSRRKDNALKQQKV